MHELYPLFAKILWFTTMDLYKWSCGMNFAVFYEEWVKYKHITLDDMATLIGDLYELGYIDLECLDPIDTRGCLENGSLFGRFSSKARFYVDHKHWISEGIDENERLVVDAIRKRMDVDHDMFYKRQVLKLN